MWRSRDDAKVRSSHAEHDDQVFRWDQMPKDGHPGQAHNCRCVAEPIAPNAANEATLIDYVPNGDGFPIQNLTAHQTGGGHTIKLHVGKSENYLLGRVTIPEFQSPFHTVYRWRHGSFSSLAAAERLTNANLSRNAAIVNAVASGQMDDAFIETVFSSVTGQEAYRLTQRRSSPIRIRITYGVGTYIRHAPDMPNGFIIITSYPRND